jgi:hypothetical protein
MSMHDQNLSPKESLAVISAMIQQAQGKMRNNSFYFLLWGWAITLANFGMYALMKLNYAHPYVVWLVSIPAWVITMIYGSKQDKQAGVSTHLDKVNMWMWICYGISIAPIVFFMDKINYQINPIILIMTGVPTFLTGILLRFKPLMFGGINFWLMGIACFMVDSQTQYLIGGFAIMLGYLVPGYMLRRINL